jgi:hypothetical protein
MVWIGPSFFFDYEIGLMMLEIFLLALTFEASDEKENKCATIVETKRVYLVETGKDRRWVTPTLATPGHPIYTEGPNGTVCTIPSSALSSLTLTCNQTYFSPTSSTLTNYIFMHAHSGTRSRAACTYPPLMTRNFPNVCRTCPTNVGVGVLRLPRAPRKPDW